MTETVEFPLRVGVETMTVRQDLGRHRPRDRVLSDMRAYFAPHGARYVVRDKPPGVGNCWVENTARGWAAGIDANLTTLLYGPGSEVGSLTAGEIPLATDRLLLAFRRLLPGLPISDEAWRHDVVRYDPSTTAVLPDGVTPTDAVHAAFAHWASQRVARQVLTLTRSTGSTVTYRRSAGSSLSVYDKTAEAALNGKTCPDRTVRLEARVRPAKPIPLSNLGDIVESAADHVGDLASSLGTVVQTATQVTVHTLVEAQKALGEEPNVSEALTLTAIHQLLRDSGDLRILIQEGMSRSTAYRRRARLHELLAATDEALQDRAAADVFGMTEVLLARQLIEQL